MNQNNFSFVLSNINHKWITGVTPVPNQIPVNSTLELSVSFESPSIPQGQQPTTHVEVILPSFMMLVTSPNNVTQNISGTTNTITIIKNQNSGNATSTAVTFKVKIGCAGNKCTGFVLPNLTANLIENGSTIETITVSNYGELWNESLFSAKLQLLYPQALSAPSGSPTTIAKGSTVRYKIGYNEENSCLDNGQVQINLNIPPNAIFKGAFQRNATNHVSRHHQLTNVTTTPSGIIIEPNVWSNIWRKYIYIDIEYPCTFTANNAIVQADVTYTTVAPKCPITVTKTLSITSNVAPPVNISSLSDMASIRKGTHGQSNNIPGGVAIYIIFFKNESQHPLTDIVITDILPANLTPANARVIYYPYLQAPSIALTAPSTYTFTLQAGEVVLPGDYIELRIWATIDASLPFSTSTNPIEIDNEVSASFRPIITDCDGNLIIGGGNGNSNGNGNGSTNPEIKDEHTLTLLTKEPRLHIVKAAKLKPCYKPGDIIRFYITVENKGNGSLPHDLNITDNLPANLEYIGNETFYNLEHSNSPINANHEITTAPFVTHSNVLNTQAPTWTVPLDLLEPIVGNDYNKVIIVFDCQVNNIAMPNNQGINNPKNFDINHSFHSGSPVIYDMCIIDELQAEKFVSADGGTTFSDQVTAAAGSTVRYQLKLTNTGNTPLTNIRIVDDMPHVGDLYLNNSGTNCILRESKFEIVATNFNSLATGTIQHIKDHRPKLDNIMDYTAINNSNIPVPCPGTNPTAFQATAGSGFFIDLDNLVMQPGDTWTFEYDGIVSTSAQNGEKACNTFLFRASRDGGTVVLELGESNDACVVIENPTDETNCNCDICEDLTIEELHTEITNENRDCESYQLVTTYLGISSSTVFTTIRASVISYDLSANYTDCIKCIKKPFMWASLYGQELQGITPSVPIGNNLTSPYIVPNHPYTNIREVIWENADGFNLSQINKLPIEIYLPPVTELPCCEIYAKICIRLTFITENCQVCEEILCIDASSLKRKNKKTKEKVIAKSKHKDCGCKDKKHVQKSKITSTDDCGCKGKKQKKAKKKGAKNKNLKA